MREVFFPLSSNYQELYYFNTEEYATNKRKLVTTLTPILCVYKVHLETFQRENYGEKSHDKVIYTNIFIWF